MAERRGSRRYGFDQIGKYVTDGRLDAAHRVRESDLGELLKQSTWELLMYHPSRIALLVAAALVGRVVAGDLPWYRLSPIVEAKPIPDSFLWDPDGSRLALFRVWTRVRATDGSGQIVVSLVEFNCASSPRSYRDIEASLYSASGDLLGQQQVSPRDYHLSKPGNWVFIVPDTPMEAISKVCDASPGVATR